MAAQLRKLAINPPQDDNERRELYEAARNLYMALETPFDAMHRLFWSVSGVDAKVFDVANMFGADVPASNDTDWH